MNPEATRVSEKLSQLNTSAKRQNRIVRYFSDVHLGNGHDGLKALAKKHDIDVDKLEWGQFVIFTNRSQTALKMYSAGQLIAHLRLPQGMRLNPRVISLIPRYFSGSRINYEGAIAEVIRKEFKESEL